MFSRIQTLFIFCVLLCAIGLFFLPIANFSSELAMFDIGVLGLSGNPYLQSNLEVNTMPLIIVLSAMAVFALAGLFYFKNRKMQLKINRLNILIVIFYIGTAFFYTDIIKKRTGIMPEYFIYTIIIAILPILFLFLANYFIRKDERLVRSADRLR